MNIISAYDAVVAYELVSNMNDSESDIDLFDLKVACSAI